MGGSELRRALERDKRALEVERVVCWKLEMAGFLRLKGTSSVRELGAGTRSSRLAWLIVALRNPDFETMYQQLNQALLRSSSAEWGIESTCFAFSPNDGLM